MLALSLLLVAFMARGARAAGSAATAEQSRNLAARILSQDGYQTELPGVEGEAGTGEASPHLLRPASRKEWSIPVPAGLGALLEMLVWIGAGAVALGVVVMAVQMAVSAIREGRRAVPAGKPRSPGPEGGAPASGRAPKLPALSEAERLAAAGRYTEAVHLLLVRALAALGLRGGRAFPDSATSREILASSRLAPGQRVPLGALVTPVERAVFGGAALGAEDWEQCRAAYRALEDQA